jgi:hypothetical protein
MAGIGGYLLYDLAQRYLDPQGYEEQQQLKKLRNETIQMQHQLAQRQMGMGGQQQQAPQTIAALPSLTEEIAKAQMGDAGQAPSDLQNTEPQQYFQPQAGFPQPNSSFADQMAMTTMGPWQSNIDSSRFKGGIIRRILGGLMSKGSR